MSSSLSSDSNELSLPHAAFACLLLSDVMLQTRPNGAPAMLHPTVCAAEPTRCTTILDLFAQRPGICMAVTATPATAGGRGPSLLEVQPQPRLMPLHGPQASLVRQGDIGRAHVGAAKAD